MDKADVEKAKDIAAFWLKSSFLKKYAELGKNYEKKIKEEQHYGCNGNL